MKTEIELLKDENKSLLKIQDQLLSKIRQLEETVEFGVSEGTPHQHNIARIKNLESELARVKAELDQLISLK